MVVGVGGVCGGSRVVLSNGFQRVEAACESARLLTSSLNHISAGTDGVAALANGGTVVWVAAGLAVIMMGFVQMRPAEAAEHRCRVVIVGSGNKAVETIEHPSTLERRRE